MKGKPNLYHGHCRRSLKTKQGISYVVDGEGKLTETEEETAAALNSYYHSVFTKDDLIRNSQHSHKADRHCGDGRICGGCSHGSEHPTKQPIQTKWRVSS